MIPFKNSLPLKMKMGLLFLSLLCVAGGLFFYFQTENTVKENAILTQVPIHFHAGFQVYAQNQKQDFSDFKYMHLEPCSEDSSEKEDAQNEKAHLHDGVGDVVHVHREAALWKDLFQNISYSFSGDLIGYINGQRVPDVLSMPILPNSSAVFFVGENENIEEKLQGRVTQEHIKEVESKSENCADTK